MSPGHDRGRGLIHHADRFAPLPAERAGLWSNFGRWETAYFPQVVGIELEEVRLGYARMRMVFRPELNQPAGVVHGGAVATLIDTAVVPAIGSGYTALPMMFTVNMQVQYLDAVRGEDAIAEAWVEKRGRALVFTRVEVRTASDVLAATGALVYKVASIRPV
jgi:uncharacterized protein (TIGR00369 family)